MSTLTAILLSTLLAGCTTLPRPTEPLPAPNAQIRLTESAGAVEGAAGGLFGGAAQGASCILSILGAPPAGVAATLTQGSCSATFGAPASTSAPAEPLSPD